MEFTNAALWGARLGVVGGVMILIASASMKYSADFREQILNGRDPVLLDQGVDRAFEIGMLVIACSLLAGVFCEISRSLDRIASQRGNADGNIKEDTTD